MEMTADAAERDLQTYRNALRFPPELEAEFRADFSERQPQMLRRFFALGLALYMSFAILDYWALPIFYPTAWALRLIFGIPMLRMIFHTESKFFKRNVFWLSPAWTFWAGISVLIMIYVSLPPEPAYVYYSFGLLLITVATYIPSSGDLRYPAIAGWLTILGYLAIGIFHQDMLATPNRVLTFFVISYFLVGMNILCMIGGAMLVVSQRRDFLQRRLIDRRRHVEAQLRQEADQLLLNVLPASVADRLKRGEVVADLYDDASILFADIVNFTPFSSKLELQDLVHVLNDVFCEFDAMAQRFELERIKTTGDGYLVASGVPIPRSDHAIALTRLGLEMCDYFNRQTFAGQRLALRVGISSGPVVAAVIGLQRFSYDVWGDTVNTASRMESHGQSGVVQITESTYRLVRDEFLCEPRGRIDVKGKGQMDVWHVVRPL
jgi:adenylate cyclase